MILCTEIPLVQRTQIKEETYFKKSVNNKMHFSCIKNELKNNFCCGRNHSGVKIHLRMHLKNLNVDLLDLRMA